eukprot:1941099-Alexandrium_andersonii.AAC.1
MTRRCSTSFVSSRVRAASSSLDRGVQKPRASPAAYCESKQTSTGSVPPPGASSLSQSITSAIADSSA